jgi:hypothetical protein
LQESEEATAIPAWHGTVFGSESRGCWLGRKPIGKKKGKTIYLTRYGDTQAEAIRRRDLTLPPDPNTITVGEWADRWLESAKVREQTRDGYRQSVELRIKPELGHRPVAEVTAFEMERAAAA